MMIAWTNPADLVLGRLDCEFYQPEYVAHEEYVNSVARMCRLPIETLGTLAKLKTGPFGSKLPSSLYRDSGYSLFRVQNVVPFFPDDSNMVFLDAETQTYLEASEVRPGSVLISKAGRLGDTCILPEKYGRSNITEHVIGLEVRSGVDPYYLVAALNERFANTQAKRFGLGTIISYLGIEATRTIRVPLPNDEIQRSIGNKLRKAERLRELGWANWRKAGVMLETQLGITLSPESFAGVPPQAIKATHLRCIQTDPAIVYAEVDDVIGAQYYHPRRIHAQSVVSSSGKWTILRKVAKRIPRKGSRASGDFVGLDRIDSANGVIAPQGAVPPQGEVGTVFEEDDILFSRLRPYLNKVSIWPRGRPPGMGSGELIVYRSQGEIDPHYLFFALKCPLGMYQVIDVTSGSTHPRVDSEVVDAIRIPRLELSYENTIGALVLEALSSWYAVPELISQATADVGAFVSTRLDTEQLLSESREHERWLNSHPVPVSCERTQHARNA
jgi:type I restriction enzyme S subunit